MFTGIVETVGEVIRIVVDKGNVHFAVRSSISDQLKIDQSVAHNGVCLTVIVVDEGTHTVTAIDETLNCTDLGTWRVGQSINLERCMRLDGRLDGHIVQGHVDATARVTQIVQADGSHVFTFELAAPNRLMVNKGSVTVNGVSLTCFAVSDTEFSVAIIPYTYLNTVFNALAVGSTVNIEFDIIGKYVQRMMGG